MKPPTVSVCIPSYNHAKFLPATLDSILGQTFQDFEIVAVDDGSSDGSLDILHDYARQYSGNIHVFTHPGRRNLGIAATANLAFIKSSGTYWCGHTSDDVSYPNRLERQVSFLENHHTVGWVYSVAEMIDANGARLDQEFGVDLSSCPDIMERLIWRNCIVAPSTMVRRECRLRVHPEDESLVYSDWDLFVRLAASYSAAFVPPPIVQYRVHGSNTSLGVPLAEQARRILAVMVALRHKADSDGGRLSCPRTKSILEFQQASLFAQVGDFESARRKVRGMLESDPSLRDLKDLAQWLLHEPGRRLALAIMSELRVSSCLVDRAFLSTLLRIFVYSPLQRSFR